jgi:uncharacterized protein DUF6152
MNRSEKNSGLSVWRIGLGPLVLSILLAQAASAHHSFTAEFVADKKATMRGTITQVWFKNPHVRFLMAVEDENGQVETWDARGSPVVSLLRKGWTRHSVKVGDQVAIYGFLGRDGRKMLSVINITMADGTVLVDSIKD